MKLWTYGEMLTKVKNDCDLNDETFINEDEFVGYFNEALNEAESEIIVLNQDYFLTKAFIPVVQGTQRYKLPFNIYSNKIRGMIYRNGAIIYDIPQFRRKNKFLNMAFAEYQPNMADWYSYFLPNDVVGQNLVEFLPQMRDTAVLSPEASIFAPVVLWYLRNCSRVPYTGEYCNPEVIAPAQINTGTDEIQTYAGNKNTIGIPQQWKPGGYPGSIAYKTGDAVQFELSSGGSLPAPLVEGTTYYVIAGAGGLIKLATTKALALAGTAIDLTTTGSVYFIMRVAATTAIIKATIIDIPEFSTFVMQWVKCRSLEKESDPRLAGAADLLGQQKKQMVDTLTQMVPDDDDTIQGDFSIYEEMS